MRLVKVIITVFLVFMVPLQLYGSESEDIVQYVNGAKHTRIIVKMNVEATKVATVRKSGGFYLDLNKIAIQIGSETKQLFSEGLIGTQRSSSIPNMFDEELSRYIEIEIPSHSTEVEIRQAIKEIGQLANVSQVYAEPEAVLASIPTSELMNEYHTFSGSITPILIGEQGYLEAAPIGIDAKYAWTFNGGKGRNVDIIDVEAGWNEMHEDFPNLFARIGSQRDDLSWRNHGTAVLGVIAASDNNFGNTGIVSAARVGFSSIHNRSSASAIKSAADTVGPGGIVLIELHRQGPDSTSCSCNKGQCNLIPVEYWSADYAAIRYAVNKGVVVVEAAGNGSVNLDHAIYQNRFDRTVRDSGAILVGASESYSRKPACYTNSGSRVDVHSWGWNVSTTGYGTRFNGGSEDQWYTNTFSGTSSASPIIVGAVASLQGIAKENLGETLTPTEVRDLISDTSSRQTHDLSRNIGGQPDLRSAVDALLGNKISLDLVSHSDGSLVIVSEQQQLIVKASAPLNSVLDVVSLSVNGVDITAPKIIGGTYYFNWYPSMVGNYNVKVIALNDFGSSVEKNYKITVVTKGEYVAILMVPINYLLLN